MVFPPECLLANKRIPVAIVSNWEKEIAAQLRYLGVESYFSWILYFMYGEYQSSDIIGKKDVIEEVAGFLADSHSLDVFKGLLKYKLTLDPFYFTGSPFRQYFHPQVVPKEHDLIVDAGALNGDTAIQYCRFLNNACRVYAFEPCAGSFAQLTGNVAIECQEIIVPVCAGLYDFDGTLYLNTDYANPGSFRNDSVGTKIDCIALDSFVEQNKITKIDVIKMDVEGSEIKALQGSINTIKKNQMQLSISIYHKLDDFWNIPFFIRELGYRNIYLGHHTLNSMETVLYAKS